VEGEEEEEEEEEEGKRKGGRKEGRKKGRKVDGIEPKGLAHASEWASELIIERQNTRRPQEMCGIRARFYLTDWRVPDLAIFLTFCFSVKLQRVERVVS
jgi:hypothetical protein